MISVDEDALICDLAETYGILDYKSLPARTVATFASGLRNSSRIMQKMSDMPYSVEDMMLVKIYDTVNWLAWTKTKDAEKGGRPPETMFSKIFKKEKEEVQGFDSGTEFEKAREEILRGM